MTAEIDDTEPLRTGELLDSRQSSERFEALGRYLRAQPQDRFPGIALENLRTRSPILGRRVFAPIHYLRFTSGTSTVYGHWIVGNGFNWVKLDESEEAPFDICSSSHPVRSMTDDQRARFLRQLREVNMDFEQPPAADVRVAARGEAAVTTVVGAEYLWASSEPGSDFTWIYDPGSGRVLDAWDSD